jgi:hypothetical protein
MKGLQKRDCRGLFKPEKIDDDCLNELITVKRCLHLRSFPQSGCQGWLRVFQPDKLNDRLNELTIARLCFTFIVFSLISLSF